MAALIARCVTAISGQCQKLAHDARIIAAALQNSNHPGLDFNLVAVSQPVPRQSDNPNRQSFSDVLDSIFSNVLLAVPKSRRSLERRMTRRMRMAGHFEYAVPRKDIVMDLDTGHWKERGTVCKHHYEKVKAETERMKEELGEAMQYTADQKEVVFLYQGEENMADVDRSRGKHVVQMKTERPSWFSKTLLKK